MSEFTQEEIEKLISLVSQNTMLYDHELVEYNKSYLKEKVWNEIALTLNKTNQDCKKQWKVLRDSFARYKRQHNISSISLMKSSKKTRNYKNYKLLSFLDTVNQRKGYRKPPKTTTKETLPYDEDIQYENEEYLLSDSDNNPHSHTDNISQTETDHDMNSLDLLNTNSNKNDDSLDSISKKALVNSNDDIESFAIYVRNILKMLPPVSQINAKQDIFNVLSKYQMIAVNKNNSSFNNINMKIES